MSFSAGGTGIGVARIAPAPARTVAGALRQIYGTRATIALRDFSSLLLSGSKARIHGMQLTRGNADGQVFQVANGAQIADSILDQGSSDNILVNSAGSGGRVTCSLLVGRATGTFLADGNGGLVLERCTLVANGAASAARSNFGGLGVVGCAFFGFTTDVSGALAAGSTHNASSNGTVPGTSGQTDLASADFVNTTSGSEDYRRASGSTKLGNTGTTVSGVTADFFGVSIPQGPAPDIGATEFEEASGLVVTGSFTLDDFAFAGTIASAPASSLLGTLTLDNFVLSGTLGLLPGRVDSPPFTNWTGTLLPGITVPNVVFLRLDRTTALSLTSQTTAGDAVLTVENASLVSGVAYVMVTYNADGTVAGAQRVVAA